MARRLAVALKGHAPPGACPPCAELLAAYDELAAYTDARSPGAGRPPRPESRP